MDKGADVLGRHIFVERVINILDRLVDNKEYCSFAIDGRWGVGKSFVVSMLSDRMRDKKYNILNYNCWESSYYNDPLMAILSNILTELCENNYITEGIEDYKKIITTLGTMCNGILNHFTGIDVINSVTDGDNNQTIADKIKKVRDIISENTKDKPIIVIVDEIDRCLPDYAIKVLERMYLIFNDLPNVFIITVMDKGQITHSIKQIFGKNISVEGYLQKFSSFTIPLDKGEFGLSIFEKYKYHFDKYNIPSNQIVNTSFLFDPLINDVGIRGLDIIIRRTNMIHRLIKIDARGITLMCAELIVSAIYYVEGDYDITIFNPTNQITNLTNNAEEMEVVKFLKNYVKKTQTDNVGNTYGGKKVLYNSLEENVLWLCNCTVDDNRSRGNGTYYYLNVFNEQIETDIVVIKEFYKLLQYIK